MGSYKYHWVKDGDFPKDGQDVWCWYKSINNGYYGVNLYYDDDLYALDKYDFPEYENEKHGGFCRYDSEYGWVEYKDVVCWAELPPMPEELERRK